MVVQQHLHGYTRSDVKQLMDKMKGQPMTDADGNVMGKVVMCYRVSATTIEFVLEAI